MCPPTPAENTRSLTGRPYLRAPTQRQHRPSGMAPHTSACGAERTTMVVTGRYGSGEEIGRPVDVAIRWDPTSNTPAGRSHRQNRGRVVRAPESVPGTVDDSVVSSQPRRRLSNTLPRRMGHADGEPAHPRRGDRHAQAVDNSHRVRHVPTAQGHAAPRLEQRPDKLGAEPRPDDRSTQRRPLTGRARRDHSTRRGHRAAQIPSPDRSAHPTDGPRHQ